MVGTPNWGYMRARDICTRRSRAERVLDLTIMVTSNRALGLTEWDLVFSTRVLCVFALNASTFKRLKEGFSGISLHLKLAYKHRNASTSLRR